MSAALRRGALALDHGTKRTGFACSDALRITLTPLDAFQGPGDSPELFRAVQAILDERDIDTLLVGWPCNMDGSAGPRAKEVEAFAQRLDGALPFRVKEAQTGDPIVPGRVYIAPGGEQLELGERGGKPITVVSRSGPTDPYAPSVDRLFLSVAKAGLSSARGVVLTGMGNDGGLGVKALLAAGAEVWVESEETAVVFGMPQAAIANGPVTRVLALSLLGPQLAQAIQVSRGSGNFPALKPKK